MLSAMAMHSVEWLAIYYNEQEKLKEQKEKLEKYPEEKREEAEDGSAGSSAVNPIILEKRSKKHKHKTHHEDHEGHAHTLFLQERKKKITTYTLEFGICIHSVIIGVQFWSGLFHIFLVINELNYTRCCTRSCS